mmetsp:Transcript_117470/g.312466  ORF Transcript_117470/g.312466 Transcript_117470/m.312466 type:complete len:230 (-) Transcript_117470:213-902(-)
MSSRCQQDGQRANAVRLAEARLKPLRPAAACEQGVCGQQSRGKDAEVVEQVLAILRGPEPEDARGLHEGVQQLRRRVHGGPGDEVPAQELVHSEDLVLRPAQQVAEVAAYGQGDQGKMPAERICRGDANRQNHVEGVGLVERIRDVVRERHDEPEKAQRQPESLCDTAARAPGGSKPLRARVGDGSEGHGYRPNQDDREAEGSEPHEDSWDEAVCPRSDGGARSRAIVG